MPFILPHGGYGLGNELMPLGKAYLLAKECNGILLDMSWRIISEVTRNISKRLMLTRG